MKKYIFAGFVLLAVTSFAGVVPVFGLPLGGKFSTALPRCPVDASTSKVMCWVGKPFLGGGGALGSIGLPGADTRPAWAAYAMFEVEIDKHGVLDRLRVRAFDGQQKPAIEASIARRFGVPTTSQPLVDHISSATWVRDDIDISLICKDECFVEFKRPAGPAVPAKPRAVSP
jgi:hypothetical protein